MATILSADQQRSIDQLCGTFPGIDRDVIQSIAESYHFDINETYRVLDDMSARQEAEDWSSPNYSYSDNISSHQTTYDKIIGFISSGYKILIFIRGLPGSGKSSLATNILQDTLSQANRTEHIFSSRDHMTNISYNKFITSAQRDAREENQRQCFASIKRGVSPVIIDDTNLELDDMKVYCVMAVEYNYMIEIITPSTPWALDPRILATKNSDRLGEAKIREMLQRYDQYLSVGDIFRRFSLNYVGKMPQFRKVPPFSNAGETYAEPYYTEPIGLKLAPEQTGDPYSHQAKLFIEQLGGDKDLMRKIMLLLGNEFTSQELQDIISELRKKSRTRSAWNLATAPSYPVSAGRPGFLHGSPRGKRCGGRHHM